MKTRTGFVSNSSSSSFVLAIRDDCTLEDIKNEILKDVDNIKVFADEGLEYAEEASEFEELKGKKLYTAIADKVSQDILNEFTGKYATFLHLDKWKVTAREYGNESEMLTSIFIYNHCGEIDTEKIKLKSTD